MYSFLMNEEGCPYCKVNLVGEGTIKVNDNLQSVNEAGRVVENISEGNDLDDTDVILDYRTPKMTCAVCNGDLDYSYNKED